jgi:hypothetical protein
MDLMKRVVSLGSLVVLVLAAMPASRASDASAVRRGPACTITGTNRDDDLRGTPGPDVICALRGADQIEARGGDDLILAGAGSDLVEAGFGDDLVRGQKGRDILLAGEGRDRVIGGPGRDDVRGELGRDRIVGGPGGDVCLSAMDGHAGDRVVGGEGDDTADRDPGDHLRSVEEVTPNVCFGE